MKNEIKLQEFMERQNSMVWICSIVSGCLPPLAKLQEKDGGYIYTVTGSGFVQAEAYANGTRALSIKKDESTPTPRKNSTYIVMEADSQ
jgi:hypothetical protein